MVTIVLSLDRIWSYFIWFFIHCLCSWIVACLQFVMLEKFLMRAWTMEIIHSRSAPMGLEALAVLAITGLLVRQPYLSFQTSSLPIFQQHIIHVHWVVVLLKRCETCEGEYTSVNLVYLSSLMLHVITSWLETCHTKLIILEIVLEWSNTSPQCIQTHSNFWFSYHLKTP